MVRHLLNYSTGSPCSENGSNLIQTRSTRSHARCTIILQVNLLGLFFAHYSKQSKSLSMMISFIMGMRTVQYSICSALNLVWELYALVAYKDEMWVLGSLGTAMLGERRPYIAAYNFEQGSWRTISPTGPVPYCISRCITFDTALCETSLILGSQDGLYTLDLEAESWSLLYKPPQATPFWGSYSMCVEVH